MVAIRGFVYLILEQLRAAPGAAPPTSFDEAGPSQASGSQVGPAEPSALVFSLVTPYIKLLTNCF